MGRQGGRSGRGWGGYSRRGPACEAFGVSVLSKAVGEAGARRFLETYLLWAIGVFLETLLGLSIAVFLEAYLLWAIAVFLET